MTRVRYRIEPRLSRFTVQAFAGGILSGFGHNPEFSPRDFAGEAWFSPGAPLFPDSLKTSSIRITIPAAELVLTNEVSDKDRREIERIMRDEVIETARFPEIVYAGSVTGITEQSPSRYRVQLDGDLSLHGVTRPQRLSADITVVPDQLRASGKFSVMQTHFGIKLVSAMGGSIRVKDEIRCSFDISAKIHQGKSQGVP
jgi:polyisoprenoid-binding protein YceI